MDSKSNFQVRFQFIFVIEVKRMLYTYIEHFAIEFGNQELDEVRPVGALPPTENWREI